MKQVYNPYLPSYEYVPDGEPRVFNNRLYVYGSHDRFNGSTYCMEPYTVWSCPINDLSDWTCHGMIYDGKEDTLNETKERLMFAPDCIEKDGVYYLFYGLDNSRTISVATSNCPEGPFIFYGNVHHPDGTVWGMKEGDRQQFDPGIFIDDDKKIYLYSGFSSTPEVVERIKKKIPSSALKDFNLKCDGSWVCQLEEDMLTLKGDYKMIVPGVENSVGTGFEGHEFFEASSMRKYNGKYYYIYSSVLSHELCYAMSEYPDRDFVYKGVLHSNGNIGIDDKPTYYYGNNHGSLVEINGHYYIFGHRHTNSHQYSRQGVAEEIFMNEDGTFNQAEMTSCGLNGNPLKAGIYPAYIACVLMKDKALLSSEKTDLSMHPSITQDEKKEAYITNIQDGVVIGFKYFEMESLSSISILVKASLEGVFYVRNEYDGENIAEIHISACGDWKKFKADIHCFGEKKAIYFIYKGEGRVDFREFTIN